jgi:hypothetical protein
MQIERDRKVKVLTLKQSKYTSELLEKCSMAESKPRSVPATAALKLKRLEDEEAQLSSSYPYQELVGALIYLSVYTHPHLAYIIGVLSH